MMNVDKVAISLLKIKLEPKYRKQLRNMFVGMPDCTFKDFFARIFTKFGQQTPYDINTNDDCMKAPWDPTEDISVLLKKICDASVFAYFINHPQTNRDLVTAGEKAILNIGLFAIQYQNLKCCNEHASTWTDF